jgi:hypothetical protein
MAREAPDGARVIEFPTNLATIVGRWACDGPADLEAVRALQRGLGLEPSGTSRPATGLPVPAAVPDELAFFERLRTWMQAFPPSAQDQEYQQRFAADGSLTIVIQHQPPPDTSNWLPAPPRRSGR